MSALYACTRARAYPYHAPAPTVAAPPWQEKYVARLLEKTGTSNRTQLVRRALQIGLLSNDPSTFL